MKCTICKSGETKDGHTTATMTKGNTTVVFQEVPASVCENCGEAFFSEETTAKLLKLATEAAKSGVQVEVREYLAA
jgi:YgiT-type zinc finger domain-containing protein